MRRFLFVLALLALAALPFAVSAQSDATPLIPDEPAEGQLSEDTPEAVYSFEGEADSTVILTLVSDDIDPFLVLSDADGTEIATDDDSAGSLDAQIQTTLPADGTYLVTVTSFAARSGLTGPEGAYTLTLILGGALTVEPTAAPASVVRPASGDATPISVGDTVEGSLTADAPAVDYSFQGEAGSSVQITLTAEDIDTYLLLSDADGNVLATDDDGAGDLDSQIDFNVPADGEYIITATTYAANNGMTGGIGDYTLSLQGVERETIEYGETVRGSFAGNVLSQVYTFTAAADDSVIIRLESDDFDSYLRLSDPSGSEIAYNDDGAGNLNSLIGPLLLTEGGVYSINASSLSGSSTGNYVLTLTSADLQGVEVGTPVTGELTPANGSAYFVLQANAGDTISVAVDSEIDTNVAVNDPFNYQVAFDEDGGSGNNPELTDVVLTSDGQYTIVVSSPFAETGEFTLLVERAELSSLNDGPVTLSFNANTTTRVVEYTAEAGESLRLTLSSLSGDQISPNVDGQQSGSSVLYGSANYVTEFSVVFEAPSDGPITLTINDYSYDNRQVEVRISAAE
jgi:hypothetical protein